MTPTTRPPLTTNHYAGTKDIAAHRRAVLAAFAALDAEAPGASMTRREAQIRAYGTDLAGATSAASAIRWLLMNDLIRTVPGNRYRLTVEGRVHHDLARDLFDGDA